MVTIELAYRLRFVRGLPIPVTAAETPRLAEIAARQKSLFDEIAELDKELERLYLQKTGDRYETTKEN